jgi:hypothetical protein
MIKGDNYGSCETSSKQLRKTPAKKVAAAPVPVKIYLPKLLVKVPRKK